MAVGSDRYGADALAAFAADMLIRAALPADRAADVADVLVEGDRLGKPTHGIALLPLYVRELEAGGMASRGDPVVLRDAGACLTWDGAKLPGAWLVRRGVREALDRARRFGLGAVAIQRSHHTGCLGAYLRPAVEAGCLLLVTLTDPGHSSVAPFGGTTPVLTSNPLAFGAPGPDGPVLIDMSTALLTNGAAAGFKARGEVLPYPALMDGAGRPSADPACLAGDPPGTILPLGGMEAGHKGFSLGLMVELLTGCLSGRGRSSGGDGWSAAVFLLAIDPAFFGGAEAFAREVEALSARCRASATRPGFDRVAMPGEGALRRRERGRRCGVELAPATVEALAACARRLGGAMPDPLPTT